MSEFKEKFAVNDEILQDVAGGSSPISTYKCTLCDKTFAPERLRDQRIIQHLCKDHKISANSDIVKELNKIKANPVT